MNIEKKNRQNFFIKLSDAKSLLREELKESYNNAVFEDLIASRLVVTITDEKDEYLYGDEFEICKNLLWLNSRTKVSEMESLGYDGTFLVRRLKIANGTYLICNIDKTVPAFVRNIVLGTWNTNEMCKSTRIEFLGTTIITSNKEICTYLDSAIYRKNKLDRSKNSSFANSGSYMGTKKDLLGFIVEALFPFSNENTIYLDIMCGSGVVSNALAQMGDVYASDAQKFCQLLAKIQGGGEITEKRAKELLNIIYKEYQYNLDELSKRYAAELKCEDMIFHMDVDKKSERYEKYNKFLEEFELYSSTEVCSEDIRDVIAIRKYKKSAFPYLLFTCYFANVYFGVTQSIQLDSIRYAIDQIEDIQEREWLLGVLIVVTSLIATTYGGHFAQPKKIDEKSFEKILVQREKSAWLEFSKRVIIMAQEGQRYPYKIKTIDGPWENALNFFNGLEDNQLMVYLDAPYKRDEYSRYYHVLETMAKYDYPECENKGRMRSKKNGERFKTEFSSKTKKNMEMAYENIIKSILEKNAVCVWSFSNIGAASIINIINYIKNLKDCDVYFFSMPHKYNSQGKASQKGNGRISVTEYVIIFYANNDVLKE